MKKSILKLILYLFVSILTCTGYATAQIGPVVSVSEVYETLPNDIKNFLGTYFPDAATRNIELKTMQNVYEIELNNGYDLEFLTSGHWTEIDAPDKAVISQNIIQGVLPGKSYDHLEKEKVLNQIDELEFNPNYGYKVSIEKGKAYYFDLNGDHTKAPFKDKKDKKGDKGQKDHKDKRDRQ